MGFRAKVQDLRIVRMVHMCEYAEKLAIDRAHCFREGRMERVVRFCRENVLVINEVLNRGHNIVDVGWCWEIDLFSTRVGPEEIQARTARHCRALMLCAMPRDDTIELVQVRVKIKNVNCNPLHDIYIFRLHHDRLEVSLHKCCVGKRGAEV